MTATAGVTYTYDGDGKRVAKSNGKLYWYGTSSDPLVETDASGNVTDEYVFFGGKRIARRKSPSGEINYYFSDHLGSSRVVTSASGSILDDADFYPFGGERSVTSSSGNAYKFTGKERDTESGLDFFIARYYSSGLGRFLSPDEFPGGPVDAFSSSDPLPPGPLPYADITNPQSLNKYTYTYNNPLEYVDPDGHQTTTAPPKVAVSTTVRVIMLSEGAKTSGGAATAGTTVAAGLGLVGAAGLAVYSSWVLTKAELGHEAVFSQVAAENKQKLTQQQQDQQGAEEKAEPEPSTEGSGARKGGGKVHGNTKGDQPAVLYEKLNAQGNLSKHGVTQNPARRYTRKELAGGRLEVKAAGPRREMLRQERQKVETNPGPQNKEPWSGKKKP